MLDTNLLFKEIQRNGLPAPDCEIKTNGFTRWGHNKHMWCHNINDNGWVFGDWKTGKQWSVFESSDSKPLSKAEKRHIRQIIEAQEENLRRRTEERQNYVATQQDVFYNNCCIVDVPANFPYLIKKQIKPVWGIRYFATTKQLIIPMFDTNGKLWSLQHIDSTGKKQFASGGRIKGCFFPIGNVKDSKTIIVCEGVATGISIYIATNIPTVAAMNAGNIDSVVDELTKSCSGKKIIIAGDNDWEKTPNTGKETACKVAQKHALKAILPINLLPGMSDFNDLHCHYGINEVTKQFKEKGML